MLNLPILFAQVASDESLAGSNPLSQIIDAFHVNGPSLVAQVINFLIVAFLLYRFAFKPVLSTLEERQKKIADGLQYAEEMKSKLTETEKKYAETVKKATQDAQRIMDDAHEHAKRITEKQTQEAIAKAEDLIRNAKEAAVQEHENMLANVRKEVVSLIVDTTQKVLNKQLSEQERAAYSEAAAKELYSKN